MPKTSIAFKNAMPFILILFQLIIYFLGKYIYIYIFKYIV